MTRLVFERLDRQPIPAGQIAAARQVDILALLPGLHHHARTSGGEWAGPCPRCGGTDRLHAWPAHPHGPRAFCRQCHPGSMDAIALVQWLGWASDFPGAVAYLTGTTRPPPPPPPAAPARPRLYCAPGPPLQLTAIYSYYRPPTRDLLVAAVDEVMTGWCTAHGQEGRAWPAAQLLRALNAWRTTPPARRGLPWPGDAPALLAMLEAHTAALQAWGWDVALLPDTQVRVTWQDRTSDNRVAAPPILAYQKERVEPGFDGRRKSFRWRRPAVADPDDGRERDWYIGKGPDAAPWPYNWPAVVGLPAGAPLLWVDGEKDVEAARTLGYVAVCAPDGGDTWRPEWSALFAGGDAWVIADNDANGTGQHQAERVAGLIYPYAAAVRVLTVPVGKDLADWLPTWQGDRNGR